MEHSIEQAARLIRESRDSLLLLTSAGMSADSGIPTFRDREGYWRNFPVFKQLDLEPQELASPYSFQIRPEHSWAFYEWRRRNAQDNRPHEGYQVLNALMDWADHAFVHTTNTDGYHLRSGVSEDRICEVHGSMWRLQCTRGSACAYGFADNLEVPLCDLDLARMVADGMPKCPDCGSLLRPHILMFGDGFYLGHPQQEANWKDFVFNAPRPGVVLLIGSSSSIPTNDLIARRYGANDATAVITINPDVSSTAVCQPDVFIQAGAREALLRLGEALELDFSS